MASTIRRMLPLDALIRKAIAKCGGCATSGGIRFRLRKMGIKINQHTILKALRLPAFELTDKGWRSELRQTTIFDAMATEECDWCEHGDTRIQREAG